MSDDAVRERSVVARQVLVYAVLAETAGWVLVFLIEAYAMIEYFIWKKGVKQGVTSRSERSEKLIRLHQFGITFFNIFTAAFILSHILPPPGYLDPALCRVLGTIPTVGYCFSVQMLYSFFLIKVDLVSGFERAQWYNRLLFIIRIVVYAFVPLVLLPVAVLTFNGEIDQATGYCQLVTREIASNTLFLVGNIFISISMVVLFVEPLRQNAKVLEEGGNGMKDSMLKIVRRNVFLTSIAITSSTVMSLVYVVAVLVAKGDDMNYIRDITLLLAYTDITINGLCAKLMTSIWIPIRARQWMFESSSASTGSKVQDIKSSSPKKVNDTNHNNKIVAASPEQSSSQVMSLPTSQHQEYAEGL